jgi:serine/threonine protein kinase
MGPVTHPHRNQAEETFVIKGVQGHPRVENERDVLKRFQNRTPSLRPLIDEIEEPSDPPIIVLKYLEDHLLNASIKKTLNRKELKYVSRRILEALKVLHEDGYVHTGKDFTRNPPAALLNQRLKMSNLIMSL